MIHEPDAPPTAAPASAPELRDPWLDNARFALIALVVFGHLLEPLLDAHPVLDAAYACVYTFHIPAFAFLSGAVTQAGTGPSRLLRDVLLRLLLPYVVFQGLYLLAAQSSLWPDDGPIGVATPYWLLWYLLSLACWRLLLPLFARVSWRLPLAVLLALAAGCFDDIGYYLSLSRTLVFFPLFLLGWQAAHAWRQRIRCDATCGVALGMLAALFGGIVLAGPDPHWLYGSYGYAAMGIPALEGMALRLLLLILTTVGALAFLTLVPQRRLPLTPLGRRSLATYLVHGFLVKLAIGAGLTASLAALPRGLLLPVLLALALAATVALSTRPVQRCVSWLIAPHRLLAPRRG